MDSRRQKRVGSLIKEELSNDLKTAHVYISFYGQERKEEILELLEKRKGYLRKSIASKVKLKYNPLLIFSLDKTLDYEERLDKLIKIARKNEK